MKISKKFLLLSAVSLVLVFFAGLSFFYLRDAEKFKFFFSDKKGAPCPLLASQYFPFIKFYQWGSPAEFSTKGGYFYIMGEKFDHGMFLPDRGDPVIYIGAVETAPGWNEDHTAIINPLITVTMKEYKYSQVNLPAGNYWIWSYNTNNIYFQSCSESRVDYLKSSKPPCGEDPASFADFGYPLVGKEHGEFTTLGGPLYVAARQYSTGILQPSVYTNTFYFGNIEEPPVYDEKTVKVTNAKYSIQTRGHEYGKLSLPAGSYWIWSNHGYDVHVVSCSPNNLIEIQPAVK